MSFCCPNIGRYPEARWVPMVVAIIHDQPLLNIFSDPPVDIIKGYWVGMRDNRDYVRFIFNFYQFEDLVWFCLYKFVESSNGWCILWYIRIRKVYDIDIDLFCWWDGNTIWWELVTIVFSIWYYWNSISIHIGRKMVRYLYTNIYIYISWIIGENW